MDATFLYLYISIIILICESHCLKLVSVNIPKAVKPGEDVELSCAFDLQETKLYSIKWYKDGVEFYRYLPKSNPKVRIYSTTGVRVDKEKSEHGIVHLENLDLYSSGTYMCEASGEKPDFSTKTGQEFMAVYVLPKRRSRPRISGEKDHYNLGDEVKFNCTSPITSPAVHLTWFINKQKVEIKPYKVLTNPIKTKLGYMYQKVSILKFILDESSFENGKAKIECKANLLDLFEKSGEILLERESSIWNKVRRQERMEASSMNGSRTMRINSNFLLSIFSFSLLFFISN